VTDNNVISCPFLATRGLPGAWDFPRDSFDLHQNDKMADLGSTTPRLILWTAHSLGSGPSLPLATLLPMGKGVFGRRRYTYPETHAPCTQDTRTLRVNSSELASRSCSSSPSTSSKGSQGMAACGAGIWTKSDLAVWCVH
jgi:hypothetical protein